jgi:hypothetical protein
VECVGIVRYDPLAAKLGAGYWPGAGDFTLGVASVLLVAGAGVDVVLLGRPEFGAPEILPLSELVPPGVP